MIDFSADNAFAISESANATVTITLAGSPVRAFRAVFDESSEVVSPYDAERSIIKPMISCLEASMAGVTGANVLEVVKDGETAVRSYALDGRLRPDGAGFTLAYLAVKK